MNQPKGHPHVGPEATADPRPWHPERHHRTRQFYWTLSLSFPPRSLLLGRTIHTTLGRRSGELRPSPYPGSDQSLLSRGQRNKQMSGQGTLRSWSSAAHVFWAKGPPRSVAWLGSSPPVCGFWDSLLS